MLSSSLHVIVLLVSIPGLVQTQSMLQFYLARNLVTSILNLCHLQLLALMLHWMDTLLKRAQVLFKYVSLCLVLFLPASLSHYRQFLAQHRVIKCFNCM